MDFEKRLSDLLSAMELMHQQNNQRDSTIDSLIAAHRLGEERMTHLDGSLTRLENVVERYISGLRNGAPGQN